MKIFEMQYNMIEAYLTTVSSQHIDKLESQWGSQKCSVLISKNFCVSGSFLVVQRVEDLALAPQWLRFLLWRMSLISGPGISTCRGLSLKAKQKKRIFVYRFCNGFQLQQGIRITWRTSKTDC